MIRMLSLRTMTGFGHLYEPLGERPRATWWTFRSKPLPALLVLGSITLLALMLSTSMYTLFSEAFSTLRPVGTGSDPKLADFSKAWQDSVDTILSGYDVEKEDAALNIQNYPQDQTLQDYVSRLSRFATEAFLGEHQHALFQPIQNLQLHASPGVDTDLWQWKTRPLPLQIISTAKDVEKMPARFSSWQTLHPDFHVDLRDDAGLVNWMDVHLPIGSSMRTVWDGLPRIVLKSDTFRYLAMLLEGGIYGDADTSAIKELSTWATNYTDITPGPLLQMETALLGSSLARGTFLEDDSISAIIAIEVDGLRAGADLRWIKQWFARYLQICQWTFAARPYHPIFIDTLETIHARVQAGDITSGALDLTGPGAFTDAVFRYLRFQYGVTPRDLAAHSGPVRVGDIIVLPEFSFGKPPRTNMPGVEMVHHDFDGSWRDEERVP